jgi:hypothetical protein
MIRAPRSAGTELALPVREFRPIYIGFLCKSVLPTGPMCGREPTYMQASAYEKQSFLPFIPSPEWLLEEPVVHMRNPLSAFEMSCIDMLGIPTSHDN